MSGHTEGPARGEHVLSKAGSGGDAELDPRVAQTAAVLAELGGLIIRLRRRDLSLTAEVVLVSLERVGPERVGDLAAVAGVSQPTMTELLRRLNRQGLVERDSHPDDRRVVRVSISDDGREFLRRRREEIHQRIFTLLRALPAEDAAALADALPALGKVLVAATTGGPGRDSPHRPASPPERLARPNG